MTAHEGACSFCSPYLQSCQHVCPTCGADVKTDDYDADVDRAYPDGIVCASCGQWTHDACAKDEYCKPCDEAADVSG